MCKFKIGFFLLLLASNSFADEKTDEALRIYYSGNTSQGMSMFRDLLEQNPDNADAILMLTEPSDNGDDFYVTELERASDLAIASGDSALGHYILSHLAKTQGDNDLALVEINKAIELEPNSIRYLRTKILSLFEKASATKNRDMLLEALAIGDEALVKVSSDPKRYFTKGALHFEIGRWLPGYNREFSEIRVKHFEEAIKAGGISEITFSYSWNNMSGALIKLDRCEEAKVAAEKALSTHDYRYARTNLAKAKKCIAKDNWFYSLWLKIISWIKNILGFSTECPELKC